MLPNMWPYCGVTHTPFKFCVSLPEENLTQTDDGWKQFNEIYSVVLCIDFNTVIVLIAQDNN